MDFFRGLALLIVLYDHVLERLDTTVPAFLRLTPYHWGLFCAASMFIFISGQAYGMAFGRIMDRDGVWAMIGRTARRIGTLYLANFTTLAALVLLLLLLDRSGLAGGPLDAKLHAYQTNYGHFGMFLAFARFSFVPDFFDILPMYMLFLLGAPFVLWGLARFPWATLAVSVGLYAARRAGCFETLSVTLDEPLYFNPIPWQLLFVMGIAARRLSFTVPRNGVLMIAAGAAVVGVALLKAGVPGLVAYGFMRPPPWWSVPEIWAETFRPELPLVRVLYFALAAFLGATLIGRDSAFWRSRAARAVMLLGRHSLLVFCSGILLVWSADVVIAHLHAGWKGALVAIAGSMVLSWLIALVAENGKKRPAAPHPAPVAV